MLVKEKHILSKENPSNIVAAIFVIRTDGSALLQHRDNKKGIRDPNIWGPPGGHVEDNETELTCAKRELFEETNYYEKTLLFLGQFMMRLQMNQYTKLLCFGVFLIIFRYQNVMRVRT